jgi:hypothetical protein
MKVNSNEILSKLRKEDRVRRTFFISSSVYEDFQKACADVAAGVVIEELMRQFVESARGRKKSET